MEEVKQGVRGAIDMTRGSPTRLILRFSLPLLVGNIFQQLYNMVDSVVVGRFVGSSALTAVSTGFPIIYLLSSLFIGFSVGATIMIAQYIGAGDRAAVSRTVDTIYSALLLAILPLTILGVVVCAPLLTLIRVPAEAYDQARVYCMVVLAGIIGSLGYNLNAGILQGLGDSKTPLIFLAVACGINVVLDLLFVIAFHWDVFGVALATIIAQFSSWVFGIFFINWKYPFVHIRFFQMKLDRPLLGQVLRLGIPSAIQECQFSLGILTMQAIINGFGNAFAAGFGAANKIDTFAFMPIQSFSTATRSNLVFLVATPLSSSHTRAPGTRSSRHRPVFFTWQTCSFPPTATWAIKRLGRARKAPSTLFRYSTSSPSFVLSIWSHCTIPDWKKQATSLFNF